MTGRSLVLADNRTPSVSSLAAWTDVVAGCRIFLTTRAIKGLIGKGWR